MACSDTKRSWKASIPLEHAESSSRNETSDIMLAWREEGALVLLFIMMDIQDLHVASTDTVRGLLSIGGNETPVPHLIPPKGQKSASLQLVEVGCLGSLLNLSQRGEHETLVFFVFVFVFLCRLAGEGCLLLNVLCFTRLPFF